MLESMGFDPVTVLIVRLIGSPFSPSRWAADRVIRLQVAALSKRLFKEPSVVGMDCIDRRTPAALWYELTQSVDMILARNGVFPPCNDLWWCLVQPSTPHTEVGSWATLQLESVWLDTRWKGHQLARSTQEPRSLGLMAIYAPQCSRQWCTRAPTGVPRPHPGQV